MSESSEKLLVKKTKIGRLAERAINEASAVRSKTARELMNIDSVVSPILDTKKYPKILSFHVGDKEYVSIRRVEGDRLEASFDRPENVSDTEMILHIPTDFLPDNDMVGILTIPYTHNIKPKSELDFLENTEDLLEDKFRILDLQNSLLNGNLFHESDWNFSTAYLQTRVIKKVQGKFYVIKDFAVVAEIKPNKSGFLEIPHFGNYYDEQEIGIQSILNKRFCVFYSVVEGSTDKERGNIKSIKSLNIPATQESKVAM